MLQNRCWKFWQTPKSIIWFIKPAKYDNKPLINSEIISALVFTNLQIKNYKEPNDYLQGIPHFQKTAFYCNKPGLRDQKIKMFQLRLTGVDEELVGNSRMIHIMDGSSKQCSQDFQISKNSLLGRL